MFEVEIVNNARMVLVWLEYSPRYRELYHTEVARTLIRR